MTDSVTATLALHHGEPSPFVQFRLPVDPLISDAHCAGISAQLQLAGQEWECMKATPTLWKMLPSKPGLYMFVWRPALAFTLAEQPGRPLVPSYILYLGQAGGGVSNNDLKSRYKGEYAKYVGESPEVLWERAEPSTRKEILRRYLALTPLEYWYCVIEERDAIKRLESRLNWMLSPPLNRVGRARLVETEAFPKPTTGRRN